MTNKKRLEEIDKRAKHRVLGNIRGEVRYRFTEINTEDYHWLIEQAERAQELEQQNKRYRKALEEIRDRGTYELNNAMKTDYAWIADEALEGEGEE